jgi:hypothetical protein
VEVGENSTVISLSSMRLAVHVAGLVVDDRKYTKLTSEISLGGC